MNLIILNNNLKYVIVLSVVCSNQSEIVQCEVLVMIKGDGDDTIYDIIWHCIHDIIYIYNFWIFQFL